MGTSYIQGTVRQVSDGTGCTPYTSDLRMYRLMLPTISLVYNNNSHGGCSAISNSKTYGSLDSNRIYDNFRPTNDINGDVEAWDSNG